MGNTPLFMYLKIDYRYLKVKLVGGSNPATTNLKLANGVFIIRVFGMVSVKKHVAETIKE
jgi:hypothetical protein